MGYVDLSYAIAKPASSAFG